MKWAVNLVGINVVTWCLGWDFWMFVFLILSSDLLDCRNCSSGYCWSSELRQHCQTCEHRAIVNVYWVAIRCGNPLHLTDERYKILKIKYIEENLRILNLNLFWALQWQRLPAPPVEWIAATRWKQRDFGVVTPCVLLGVWDPAQTSVM